MGTAAASVTRAAPPGGVTPLSVPAELRARAPSLELSGIAWCAALQRYLVVSDDTAPEGGKKHEHAPLVFAFDREGVLDPTPLRIEGIDELNDPESITAGPDGTFFVATSHSVNKHGHLPAARRKLLHVAVEGRSLRVLGQLDLTEARLLEAAKLPAGGALDIEGITFRDGALFIGLKAPLDGDGRASILRVDGVAASVAAGKITPSSVAPWSRPRLCRAHEGAEVCAGIADMTMLADGSVLLVSNSPKGMPADGGGSLWRMAGGDQPAVFVRHFPGLKPEGITTSADGASVVIVFDTDGAPPLWVRAPAASLESHLP